MNQGIKVEPANTDRTREQEKTRVYRENLGMQGEPGNSGRTRENRMNQRIQREPWNTVRKRE